MNYIELIYTDEQNQPLPGPAWDWAPDFDSLDHGLQLITEDDELFFVTWDNDFFCYGISIWKRMFWENPETPPDGIRIWNVSQTKNWQNKIHKEIINCKINWIPHHDYDVITEVPSNIKFIFENEEKCWAVAMEFYKTDQCMPFADHITVFFREDIVKQYIADKIITSPITFPITMLPSSSAIQAYKEKINQKRSQKVSIQNFYLNKNENDPVFFMEIQPMWLADNSSGGSFSRTLSIGRLENKHPYPTGPIDSKVYKIK